MILKYMGKDQAETNADAVFALLYYLKFTISIYLVIFEFFDNSGQFCEFLIQLKLIDVLHLYPFCIFKDVFEY
jgi:hypothetical protein